MFKQSESTDVILYPLEYGVGPFTQFADYGPLQQAEYSNYNDCECPTVPTYNNNNDCNYQYDDSANYEYLRWPYNCWYQPPTRPPRPPPPPPPLPTVRPTGKAI